MDFQVFLPIEKVDVEKRMVWGYASTPTKDLQGEVVTLDAIKAALPDYMQWRNIREMHTSSAVGVAKEAHVDENGLYIGAKIVDEDAWIKCKEGVYKGFSIGGSKLEKVGDTIKQLRLTEISIVDRPANPDCKIDAMKAAGVTVTAPAAADASLFGKFLDICKSFARFGADGFSAPAHVLETPTHAALEGHQPVVIPARLDNADPHPSSAMQVDLRQPGAETPSAQRVELTHAELADLNRKMDEVEFEKRDFSDKERKHLAAQGIALPDGSYPIANQRDLENAISAFGRAKDKDKAKAHITARAKALKLTNLLPADWPGSTKEEKTVNPEELQKRLAAGAKASLAKAHEHLKKAVACHGKACDALANLHKCMGKAEGGGEEQGKHMQSLAAALSSMGDHHDIAMHHLGKAASAWTGESKETPKQGEGGDVSSANTDAVDLLAHGHVTESADTTGIFATNSPYSAAALGAEIAKQVAAATKPLQDKLAETEKQLEFQKGQMSVIERMPSGGPRPRLMVSGDSTAFTALAATDPKAAVNAEIQKAWNDAASSGDPDVAIQSAARIIGLRAQHPEQFGKKITDPSYKGRAGA